MRFWNFGTPALTVLILFMLALQFSGNKREHGLETREESFHPAEVSLEAEEDGGGGRGVRAVPAAWS